MLYYSTKTLLTTVLQSLETADDIPWDDHIESSKECLYEMSQMKTQGVASAVDSRASQKASRAIPHVKLMLSAIRRRDRATAVEHGKAAFAAM
jgi:hypothetical protein